MHICEKLQQWKGELKFIMGEEGKKEIATTAEDIKKRKNGVPSPSDETEILCRRLAISNTKHSPHPERATAVILTRRVRIADLVVADFDAALAWVHVPADAAAAHVVVVDVRAVRLEAQGDEIPRDHIMPDGDGAHVVHADADEAQERIRRSRRARDDAVAFDAAVSGSDRQQAIISAVCKRVMRYESVLRADDRDVKTQESVHREAGDGDVLNAVADGDELAVFLDEFREHDVGTFNADASLGVLALEVLACEAGTGVCGRRGRGYEDRVLADKGNSVFRDRQLLGVGAGFDNDPVPRISGIDGGLDRIVVFNVDGASTVSSRNGPNEPNQDNIDYGQHDWKSGCAKLA
ncbi:hypothetical protein V500_05904 [Pseudogymnoascus sp. VKM F-4518 (FW-2643)]|nr:hypothetical protein V500_05904 [Pseudogymnoascus sp. VKM F-4518 (FW-2643)]